MVEKKKYSGTRSEGQEHERVMWEHLEKIAVREDLNGFEKLALAYEVGYSVGVSGRKKLR